MADFGNGFEVRDDTTRIVTSYDRFGVQTGTRPYTQAEIDASTAKAAAITAGSNRSILTADANADIALLIASVDSLNVVIAKANNSITGADTKQVAQESRRIARAVIRLLRLYLAALSSTNVGA